MSGSRVPDVVRAQLARFGLVVPVGSTFHEVEIVRYDVWGRAETVRTHGVLFPRQAHEPAFAMIDSWVPWPVRAIGPAADAASKCARALDLSAQSDALMARFRERSADEDHRAEGEEEGGTDGEGAGEDQHAEEREGGTDGEGAREEEGEGNAGGGGDEEERALDRAHALREEAARTCDPWTAWPLLDDLGHRALVERVLQFRTFPGRTEIPASADESVNRAIFAIVMHVFERAVTHYMHGEDAAAAADLETVARVSVETARLEMDPQQLEHLDLVPGLRREIERRRTNPADPTPDVPREGLVADSFVVPLIASLEHVDARQGGQPGGVALSRDLRVDALIRVGEPAVPALLECLEHDERWTRAVHFWRDFVPRRSVLGVHEACYVALANILGEDFFDFGSTGGNLTDSSQRSDVARSVRTHWETWRGVAPAERRWQILNDDSRTPAQWASAAEWLTTGGPARESTFAFSIDVEPAGGAALRSDRDVALRELLVRRARESVGGESQEACTLVRAALVWADGPFASVTDVARVLVAEGECGCRDWLAEVLGPDDPDLALAYIRATEHLLHDYGDAERRVEQVVVPLLRHRSVATEVDRRLRDLDVVEGARERNGWVNPVWRLAAHRAEARATLRRGLASREEVGSLDEERYDGEPTPMLRVGEAARSVELPEPFEAPRAIRVADLVADTIARRLGVGFSFGWTRERRDAAIADVRRRLARYPGKILER